VKTVTLGAVLLLGLFQGACSGPQIKMKIETKDATRSECRRRCDRDKSACLHRERAGAGEHREVSLDDWKKAYAEAQQMARACEKRHRRCVNACLD